VSKIDLVCAPAPKFERWAGRRNGLQLFRRVACALLRALRDSRGRAARTIIRDYRHLLPERTSAISSQERRKGIAKDSQENLKGISGNME
jgi:hypothetical protein